MVAFTPPNRDTKDAKFLLSFASGLNENQTPNLNEATDGYNFQLGARNTKLIPRAPFDLLGTAPNGEKITGIMQLVTRAGVKTTVVVAGTQVYLWGGGSVFTALASVIPDALLRDTYWPLTETLYIPDVALNNVVQKWDGTTFGPSPTNLPSALYAKYSVVFLGRVWYFNVICGTATPHLMLASALQDPENLSILAQGGPTTSGGSATFSTGLEAFYLLTPDLRPINGVTVFQQSLIISTSGGALFVLTGTSASTFQFIPFFNGSAAIDDEAMLNVGNDVVFIQEGGAIQLMSATQNYGDVRVNAISSWIPKTTAGLSSALIVYDQILQRVFFFIKDKILVLYKDILFGAAAANPVVNAGLSPWSVFTSLGPDGVNTKAAKFLIRPEAGNSTRTIVWGGADGDIFDLNGVGISGDVGVYPIDVKRVSRLVDLEVWPAFPYNEQIMLGKVQYRKLLYTSTLGISFDWSDEYNSSTSSLDLKSQLAGTTPALYNRASYWGGGSYWSQGKQLANAVTHQTFSPSGKGSGFYVTLRVQSPTPWQVDHLEFY
jgi:hypothetical protein